MFGGNKVQDGPVHFLANDSNLLDTVILFTMYKVV